MSKLMIQEGGKEERRNLFHITTSVIYFQNRHIYIYVKYLREVAKYEQLRIFFFVIVLTE